MASQPTAERQGARSSNLDEFGYGGSLKFAFDQAKKTTDLGNKFLVAGGSRGVVKQHETIFQPNTFQGWFSVTEKININGETSIRTNKIKHDVFLADQLQPIEFYQQKANQKLLEILPKNLNNDHNNLKNVTENGATTYRFRMRKFEDNAVATNMETNEGSQENLSANYMKTNPRNIGYMYATDHGVDLGVGS